MSRWFRHYAGMARDDKLVRVAIRSKQAIERVVWVWSVILESAAEIDDGGRYDFDAAEAAYFLRADQSDVDAIQAGLADAGHIAAGAVVKWGNRQFQSDQSRNRVAAHRERKRLEASARNSVRPSGNGDVTLQERHRNAPETEKEREKEREAIASPKKVSVAWKDGKPAPDDWLTWAVTELGWTRSQAMAEATKFIDNALAHRRTYIDWKAAWRQWCRSPFQKTVAPRQERLSV